MTYRYSVDPGVHTLCVPISPLYGGIPEGDIPYIQEESGLVLLPT